MRGEVLPRLSFGEGVGSGGEAFPRRLRICASTRLVFRDVAQSGSAPEWGSGGRGFKSRRPDSNGDSARPLRDSGVRVVVSRVSEVSGREERRPPDRFRGSRDVSNAVSFYRLTTVPSAGAGFRS